MEQAFDLLTGSLATAHLADAAEPGGSEVPTTKDPEVKTCDPNVPECGGGSGSVRCPNTADC